MCVSPSTHRQVSLSWRPSEAVKHCSQSTEPFSSFPRGASSALPLVREYFSSPLMCLLRKAKPEIQRKKESVLKPSVRPRYNILQKKEKNNREYVNLRGPEGGSSSQLLTQWKTRRFISQNLLFQEEKSSCGFLSCQYTTKLITLGRNQIGHLFNS